MNWSLVVKKRVESLKAHFPATPLYKSFPQEFAERLAMAFFDSHAAVLMRTGDEALAITAASVWTREFEAALNKDLTATKPELSTFDEDLNPFGRERRDPKAARELKRLLVAVGVGSTNNQSDASRTVI